MNTSTALAIHVHEGVPTVLDEDLGRRLGLAKPTDIRSKLIRVHRPELLTYGALRQIGVKSGGRPATETYLNEEQALLVVMFSRTPKAAEARREIITVFQAWRRGGLSRPAPTGEIERARQDRIVALAENTRALEGLTKAIARLVAAPVAHEAAEDPRPTLTRRPIGRWRGTRHPRAPRISRDQFQAILALEARGMSATTIAERIRVSQKTVRRVVAFREDYDKAFRAAGR